MVDFFISSESVGLFTFVDAGSGLAVSLTLSLNPLSLRGMKNIDYFPLYIRVNANFQKKVFFFISNSVNQTPMLS
jgi:hypothetical protein